MSYTRAELEDFAIFKQRFAADPRPNAEIHTLWIDARRARKNRGLAKGWPEAMWLMSKRERVAHLGDAEIAPSTPVPSLAVVTPLRPTLGPDAATADYETYFAHLEEANEMRAGLSNETASAQFAAPEDGLPIGIAFTGDWHCGAGGVLYKQLRADLETIRDTEGLYAIGMGDYLENVTPQSKAGTALYSGLFNEPGMQMKYARMRASIAQGKWLAIAQGNHDAWSYKWAGISRTDELAAHLGTAYFGEGGGVVYATVGDERYVIGVRHNTSGNSRLNTTNAQRRLFDDFPNWENCHAICCAHLHFNDMHLSSRKGGRVAYLRSGTYKVHDEYSTAKGFTPEYGVPLVILLPDEHRVIPFRGDDFARAVEYLAYLRHQYRAKAA